MYCPAAAGREGQAARHISGDQNVVACTAAGRQAANSDGGAGLGPALPALHCVEAYWAHTASACPVNQWGRGARYTLLYSTVQYSLLEGTHSLKRKMSRVLWWYHIFMGGMEVVLPAAQHSTACKAGRDSQLMHQSRLGSHSPARVSSFAGTQATSLITHRLRRFGCRPWGSHPLCRSWRKRCAAWCTLACPAWLRGAAGRGGGERQVG